MRKGVGDLVGEIGGFEGVRVYVTANAGVRVPAAFIFAIGVETTGMAFRTGVCVTKSLLEGSPARDLGLSTLLSLLCRAIWPEPVSGESPRISSVSDTNASTVAFANSHAVGATSVGVAGAAVAQAFSTDRTTNADPSSA